MEDRVLVNKVLGGDTNAFKDIIALTEDLVAQIVYKMVTRYEDRRDLIQDIYIKAYQSLHNFRHHSKLSTWIGKIAYNTCINHLKKKKLVLVEHAEANENPAIENLDAINTQRENYDNGPDTFLIRKELAQVVGRELDSLTPLYRTLIILFHKEELNYEEITEITSLPVGTIKSYLFRGRKVLRDRLFGHYKNDAL